MAVSGMTDPPKVEIAWAAGLFEGEGSTVLSPSGVRLQVKMTDQDVLEHLLHVLGGVLNGPYQYNVPGKPPRKPFWFWSLTGPSVPSVCRLLEPYLGKRRRERMERFGVFAQMQFPILNEALLAPDSEE